MAALAKVETENMNPRKTFAPEADCEFEPVSLDRIAKMREKLNQQYGIGKGKLKAIEEPK